MHVQDPVLAQLAHPFPLDEVRILRVRRSPRAVRSGSMLRSSAVRDSGRSSIESRSMWWRRRSVRLRSDRAASAAMSHWRVPCERTGDPRRNFQAPRAYCD